MPRPQSGAPLSIFLAQIRKSRPHRPRARRRPFPPPPPARICRAHARPHRQHAALPPEIARRRTFAIISHPDAGKTTLTEKFLLYGGAIQLAGQVRAKGEARRTRSDFMKLEQERGISVSASAMSFPFRDWWFNLVDTPGHSDFSEDTYRTLTAVDAAVMVIDGAKGVESQTRKLFEVCRLRDLPDPHLLQQDGPRGARHLRDHRRDPARAAARRLPRLLADRPGPRLPRLLRHARRPARAHGPRRPQHAAPRASDAGPRRPARWTSTSPPPSSPPCARRWRWPARSCPPSTTRRCTTATSRRSGSARRSTPSACRS